MTGSVGAIDAVAGDLGGAIGGVRGGAGVGPQRLRGGLRLWCCLLDGLSKLEEEVEEVVRLDGLAATGGFHLEDGVQKRV